MADGIVKVDSESLEEFKKAFITAGEEYQANLAKLTNFIEEVTRGDIQGTPAVELKAKFDEKRATFNNIANLIDEGKEYLGVKSKKFSDMLSELKMR